MRFGVLGSRPVDGVIRFFTGPNDSLMERLQKAFPDARFVKAFNSVGNAFMVNPSFPGGKPTMFYCGNDQKAKAVVARIIEPLDPRVSASQGLTQDR